MYIDKDRGISVGTIVMLSLTLLVLLGSILVIPSLMGSTDMHLQDGAMDASMDLGQSVRALSMGDIPITQPTAAPADIADNTDPVESIHLTPETTAIPVVHQSPAETPIPENKTLRLTFGGSIVIDDMIRKSGYYSDSQKYDYSDNLALIAESLDSDLTLVTLETITDPNRNVKVMPNAPDAVMDMLESSNVDMVALGYSRIFDYGLASVAATIREAQIRNLTTLGAYASPEDASILRVVTIQDIKIACLHYTMGLSKTGKSAVKKADAAYAVPTATIKDYSNILNDIDRAKEQGADFIIVSLNWSNAESSADYKKAAAFLQAIADRGADVIVGAGTKAIKPVSWLDTYSKNGSVRQTLCALSLGSLLIGDRKDANVAGMLLHIELDSSGTHPQISNVTYTPTYIWRFEQDDQLRYRVVESDQPAPDGMGQDHVKYAENALKNLTNWLDDSPITIRNK